MNHAEDKMLFVDLTFLPLAEKLVPQVKSIGQVVVLTDAAHMPATSLPNAVPYEEWMAEADGDFTWKSFDENTASGMCYTSGTTGNPKGVVYSHRSNVLHAMIACVPNAMGISARDVVLPVVPQFHANAWGLAQSVPMVGAKLVMPGAKLDGPSICELMEAEKVTFTAAVPTIWLMALHYLEETGKKLPHLKKVVIGGAACPRVITQKFQQNYDVEVIHAWGMTEMSPVGTLCTMKPDHDGLDEEARLDVQMKQGYPPFGVEMKVTGDEGEDMPRDGRTFGNLKVRGPAVASAYFGGVSGEQFDDDGWFDTGDVAPHRSARLHADHRSRQGRHQVRRRVDQRRSTWRTSRSGTRMSRRPQSSASVIRSGTSGRCSSSCASRARSRRRPTSCPSSRARSRNGGCRTTSPSSPKSRTPRRAKSRSGRCATCSRTIGCRRTCK